AAAVQFYPIGKCALSPGPLPARLPSSAPTVYGALRGSNLLAVMSESAPVIDQLTLVPAAPKSNDTLTATVTAHDADGDALTYTYIWKVNAVTRRTIVTSASTDSFDLGKPGNGNKGDTVTIDVTVSDGTFGATANASATVVGGRGH